MVLTLVLCKFLQVLHFLLHVNEVAELFHHFAYIVLEGLKGDDILHEGVELGLFLPNLIEFLSLGVCLLHEAVGLQN